MIKLPLSGVAVAVGGLALALTAGVGVASADPDLDPMINSTCTYNQWVKALRAENPGPASAFDSQPASQSFMQQFIASSPAQRTSMAQMVSGMPGADQNLPVIQQAFSSCNRY
jgi:hemophore-related protein